MGSVAAGDKEPGFSELKAWVSSIGSFEALPSWSVDVESERAKAEVVSVDNARDLITRMDQIDEERHFKVNVCLSKWRGPLFYFGCPRPLGEGRGRCSKDARASVAPP